MVDINTAMAAAATERRNRGTGDKERKKNRSGADMGIEAFDPVKHVAKEKADTCVDVAGNFFRCHPYGPD